MSSNAKPPPTPQEIEQLRAAETEIPQTLSIELSSETWDALEVCLEKFNEAWRESTASPPSIKPFLPERPGLRQVAIVELVKLDMEHRQNNHAHHATLEDYAAQFPELGGLDRMPVELIYEEFLVRRQTDTALRIDDYERRFPRRAAELRALAAVHEAPANEARKSTSITSLRRPDSLQVGDKVDDFDLLAMLGQGSFAKVFLARQVSLQRLVALKISAARGFESQTLAQLDHPNIVRVYDQRRLPERNLQLLYMQYMPGGTLSDVVQRVKRTPSGARTSEILLDVVKDSLNKQGEGVSELTLPTVLRGASWWKTVTWLGMNLAAALDHAHNRGVLHRDLKPANVLLGRDGNPRLADFNVSACSVVASHVSAAYFGGSLAYMSPEQLEAFGAAPEEREAMMDGRSDVFSLGILLWEVLTGTRPYRDEQISDLEPDTLLALAKRRRSGPSTEDWKTLATEAPPGFVEFFRTCLEAKPEARYPNAGAARRALMLCGNESSRALLQPQGFLAWCRRHPIWPLVIAGLIPNVISSLLNIFFNLNVIIARLIVQAESVLKLSPDKAEKLVRDAFDLSMLVINPIAYLGGIAVGVAFALPIINAAKLANRGVPVSPSMRYRSIWLPDVIAIMTAVLWILSGPAFPIVLERSGVHLEGEDFIHFAASQAICGTLAASLAFMFTAPIVLRTILPSLLDSKQDDPILFDRLHGLSTRTLYVVFASFSVVLLSAILWTYAKSDAKLAFVAFMIGGFLCGAFSFFFLKPKMVDKDIAALQSTTMIDETSGGDTQSSLAAQSRRAKK